MPEVALRGLGADWEDWEDWDRLALWFANPAIREFYYEDAEPSQVRAKFAPRASRVSRVRPRMILYRAQAVGYAQFYPLTQSDVSEYRLSPSIRWGGFDLLIEPECWGQGVGLAAVQLLLDQLKALKVSRAAIDTACENLRATRLYQKTGFKMERVLKHWERGRDHIVMTRSVGGYTGAVFGPMDAPERQKLL